MAVAGRPLFSILLLLFAGQTGAPLSLPPLPEDPVMSRVAPDECLWYLSWSGTAVPDPKSANQTEQLLAEPEVRDFLHGVGKALAGAIRKGAPPTPQGKFFGANGPRLILALLTHPAAAFVSKFGIGANGPTIEGGIVVGTGDETDKLKSTLEEMERVMLPQGAAANAASAKSAAWHKLPTQPGTPTIEWGFHEKYLIVGIGDGSADKIVARTTGNVPEWLSAIKSRLAPERVCLVHYLNVRKVMEIVGPFLGFRGAPILGGLGLDKVKLIATVSGLDDHGCVSKTWINIDGEPTGLFTLVGSQPLSAADFAAIPKDSSMAAAARFDAGQAWSNVMKIIEQLDPQPAEDLAQNIKQAESTIGFRIQEDFLQTLGDVWCIYNSPGDGGLLITGLTAVVPVKDHDRLVKSNDSLLKAVHATIGSDAGAGVGPVDLTIAQATFQKQKIYWVKPIGGLAPFEPSWCITDTQFVVSLSPQNVRALLARESAVGSLADVPEISALLRSDKPIAVGYQDTPSLLKLAYPIVQMFTTMGFSAIWEEGIDLDAAILPSLPSILRHTSPATATLSHEKDGLIYVTRQTLPIDSSMMGLLIGVAPAIILPAF